MLYGAEIKGALRLNPCVGEGVELLGSSGVTLSGDDHLVDDLPLHGRAGVRGSTCRERGCGLRRWFVEGSVRGASTTARTVSA